MSEQQGQNIVKRGLVKQVLSGDALVLQGPAVNGPPKELTVYLSSVTAPRLSKRPTESGDGSPDEPYAWDAREYLRRKVVGKTVVFIRDFLATSGREHGRIYLGGSNVSDAENVTESAVADGWLEVRPGKQIDDVTQKLLDLQEQAKLAKKGRWSCDEKNDHVRQIKWQVEDARSFVDAHKQAPIDAVIEQVRDGSTVRAFLLPSFEYVTVVFSGVKAPGVKIGQGSQPEEFGEEAKFFVESRLLQRDVKIILEGVSNQNFIGSVIHPRGNIAEFLLKDGYAKCVEWSLGLVTGGPQKLREAERSAKDLKLRLWRNYVTNTLLSSDRKTLQARVIEIGLGDSLTVIKDNGEEVKIFLSSIRAPRREGNAEGSGARQFRPLYDIPYMFETREFLRRRLIGKKVSLTLDYIQPKSDQFAEKHCFTVLHNGQNIAEQLVSNGYARVIRHRQDDDNRSSHYDDLLTAEANAEKAKKGIWTEKTDEKIGVVRVQELQGDAARSKQFLPYLQRSTRPDGIVEFVASGSRLRIYIPKETCIVTFLLAGISCPRGSRIGPGGKPQGESEPFADEALKFSKNQLLQHDVQIEVESMDKSGGFIGYLFVKNDKGGYSNYAELLLEAGLATVHFTAEKSRYYNQLLSAESVAKNARLNLWKNFVEEKETLEQQKQDNDVTERKLNLRKVLASEVYRGSLHVAVQNYEDGPVIEKLMKDLQAHLGTTNAVNTVYTPKRGDLCACIFTEVNLWHRARVESVKNGFADVLYIDFGNRENVPLSRLAPLPHQFISQGALSREYQLALVVPPSDPDYSAESDAAFQQIIFGAKYLEINSEYKIGNLEAVTLFYPDEDGKPVDVGKHLIRDGLALADKRREKRFQTLVNEYQEAEQAARSERRNIWRYGDFTGNEV